jgi:hypothetical protein
MCECSIDDSQARKDWGWKHDYDLDAMTRHMFKRLKEQQEEAKRTL